MPAAVQATPVPRSRQGADQRARRRLRLDVRRRPRWAELGLHRAERDRLLGAPRQHPRPLSDAGHSSSPDPWGPRSRRSRRPAAPVMGAGSLQPNGCGPQGNWTAVFASITGTTPALIYTWNEALADGAGRAPDPLQPNGCGPQGTGPPSSPRSTSRHAHSPTPGTKRCPDGAEFAAAVHSGAARGRPPHDRRARSRARAPRCST